MMTLYQSVWETVLSKKDIEKIKRYHIEYKEGVRSQIINKIIEKNKYSSYLEIGVFKKKVNFEKVNIATKIGVDPGTQGYSEATHKTTSDEFFKKNDKKFDIIFIDGLHHYKQVLRDVCNGIDCLNEGGTILCHDMNPVSNVMQCVPRKINMWNGDCWKAFVKMRMERGDLEMFVIDADFGIGVIRKGSQARIKRQKITYNNFKKNRRVWLNLISREDFERKLNNVY